MSELEPGDIVEIEEGGGLHYLQVTHDHVSYPQVVRALRGRHAERPSDLEALAAGPTRFAAMIPLGSALGRGLLAGRKVGQAPIPEADQIFPTFTMPIRDRTGAIAYWWFWDGEGLRYDETPPPDPARARRREVLTADSLLHRLRETDG